MRWVICPDSFKDAAMAKDIAAALVKGIEAGDPRASITAIPMSDGGEGFIDLGESLGWGKRISVNVCDALQRPLRASYLFHEKGKKAWIGIAEASGIEELTRAERDGRITTSLGSGLLILDAIKRGARELVIGLGGSAVNDGGCGMGYALGYVFYDKNGDAFLPTGATLSQIARIERPPNPLPEMRVTVLSDVRHVLTGPGGATVNFGPQKGIPPEDIPLVDQGMEHLAERWKRDLTRDVGNIPGAGAAGGMGGGCMAFLNAKPASGTEMALRETGLEEAIRWSDAVITGEGKLDATSLHGKLISGVRDICRKYDRPCYIICGINQLDQETSRDEGFTGVYAIRDRYGTDEEAIAGTLESCQAIGRELSRMNHD